MPIRRAVRMTRQAISPRLAIRSLENTVRSHPEDAKAGAVTPPVDRRVERGGDAERQHKARFGRVYDAVIPKARAGVIGMPLRFVLRADRRLEFLLLRGAPFRPARAHAVAPHRRQARGRLLAAHPRNASAGPPPPEHRAV